MKRPKEPNDDGVNLPSVDITAEKILNIPIIYETSGQKEMTTHQCFEVS